MTEQDCQDLHDRMMKDIELQRERRYNMLADFDMTDEEFFCANFRSKVDETLERIELTVY